MARTTFSGPVASQNGFISVAATSGKTLTIQAPAALSANTTLTFPNGAGSNGQYLKTDGTGNLSWASEAGMGTVTSVGGTGSVNGLSLSGTVTTSGNLTLGGSLDLSSPPAIGATTPAAGAFTEVTAPTYKAADGTTGMTLASVSGEIGVSAGLQFADGAYVRIGTTTGTKFGTTTSQKIGFYNSTPVVQPAGTGVTTGFTAGAGAAVLDDSTFTGNTGSAAYTIGDIVKALKDLGLLAA